MSLKFNIQNLKLTRLVLMAGLLAVIPPGVVWGQSLSSGADFLTIDSGARSEGMGGAFTGVADDVNALTWNPAGLALVEHPEVGYLHMLYVADLSYNFGGVVIPIPSGEDRMAVGAGMVNLGVPSFDSTLGLAPAVSAGDNAFLASFAYRVRDIVSFGVTGEYILRNLAGYNAQAVAGDLGVLWTPGNRLRVGAGIFHLGQEVKFISVGDPLPTTARLGLSYEVLDVPHNTVRLALDNAYSFQAQGYAGSVGGEYWYDKMLALRVGYTGDAYQQHFTAGIGFNLRMFQLDYAYAPLGTLGDTHRLSLILRFGAEGGGGMEGPMDFRARSFDGGVELKWKGSTAGETAGYNLYVRKPGAEGFVRINGHPFRDTSVKLKHLRNGERYAFGLTSVSGAGRESPMEQVEVAPSVSGEVKSPEGSVEAPTGFKAEAKGEGVVLTWDAEGGVEGYNLYLEEGGAERKMTPHPMKDTKVELKKVDAEKTYRFLLSAVGADGMESPKTAVLEVNLAELRGGPAPRSLGEGGASYAKASEGRPAVAAPEGFTAEPGDGSAHLSWGAVAGAVGYNLYVSEDGGKSYRLLTRSGPKPILKAILKPLRNGQAYYFAVTAVAADGTESPKTVQRVVPAGASAAR